MASKKGPGLALQLLGAGIMDRERDRERYRQRIEEIKTQKVLSDDIYEPVLDPSQATNSDIVLPDGSRHKKLTVMEQQIRMLNNMNSMNMLLDRPEYARLKEQGIEAGTGYGGKVYPKSKNQSSTDALIEEAMNDRSGTTTSVQVGQIVVGNDGRKVRVTAILPDGSIEGEVVP